MKLKWQSAIVDMIKSIKRFPINLACYCIRSILWVIRTYKRLNDKFNIAKHSFQTKSFASKKVNEPKYLTEAHRKSSEAKQATIKKWPESPTDWKKMEKLTQEHFNQHGQKNPNCYYNSFDWTKLTKNELDTLYHQIIDKALENYEYRLHVLFKWKINHEEFQHRAARSLAIRIRKEEQRMKKDDIISTYFKKRWANMTPEEVDADRKWIIEQGRLRNPN